MPVDSITWVGHATALLEVDGARVLTDPVLRSRVGPLERTASPPRADVSRDIDVVVISHLHADHADIPSLRRVGRSTPVVAPCGAGKWLLRRGLADVQELRAGQTARVGPLRLTATPALHDGRRRPFGPTAEALGFVVSGSRSAVYFAGDTDLFPGMAELNGAIDAALLPVWGWGRTLGAGHLDPSRAVTAVELIHPAIAVPIHWGTLALPARLSRTDAAERPAREFARLAALRAHAVDVRVLEPGERTELVESLDRRAS
jgi:L-ascorbate metabolism protein UlaG (beta-lactamase superfamily)